jgi:branched-chain amino acid transport system permease protein
MDIINIAAGALVILAAYLSYECELHFGLPFLPTLLLTIPVLFAFGWFLETILLSRLQGPDRIALSVMVTYAVAIVIQGFLGLWVGTNYVQVSTPFATSGVAIGTFRVSELNLLGGGIAVVLISAFAAAMLFTRFGAALRATVQNPQAALLLGIRTARIRAAAFAIGLGLTAVGGTFFGASQAFSPNTGWDVMSRLFAIVVVGGLGSLGGALAGSVVLLVVSNIVGVLWSPVWASFVFYGVLVLVLAMRPSGLLASRAVFRHE